MFTDNKQLVLCVCLLITRTDQSRLEEIIPGIKKE